MSSDNETSTDREDNANELMTIHLLQEYNIKYFLTQPYRNDSFSGREYVHNVLNGHVDRCPDMFRLKANVLYDLCDALKARGLMRDTHYVSVEEQMCIFLYMIGHNECNRNVADRFQHSQETISRHFGSILKAICKFAKYVILPPDFQTMHPYLKSKGDKYWPWFKNCIGAINGTHISTSVPAGKAQIPYCGRKTLPTQNVMCACDFDMCFTYVVAGWEGTSNDSRVFMETITDERMKFPHPPEGKYYLVDSGYSNVTGFLAPYKGERYHLNDYRGSSRAPRSAREQFNYAHSSLRNVIERCFGVLKARFPILKMMPRFSLRKQRNIVIAVCALHNYIRKHALKDDMFRVYENKDFDISNGSRENGSQNSRHVETTQEKRREMCAMRDMIRHSMAAHYRLPL